MEFVPNTVILPPYATARMCDVAGHEGLGSGSKVTPPSSERHTSPAGPLSVKPPATTIESSGSATIPN